MEQGRFLPPGDLDVDDAGVRARLHRRARSCSTNADSPVGEWLRIGDSRCRVIGVLAKQGLAGGFNVDETVTLPIANAQQIFNTSSVFRILVEASERRLRAGREALHHRHDQAAARR